MLLFLQFVCLSLQQTHTAAPQAKEQTDTINPHKKCNALREGINGPNVDILNRERCHDTGF